jgi:uncharacterized protein (TIGR02996 family)
MSEEQTFLSAIMANPDDRTTKLVYADWLEERNDPRSEIVRLKVKVAGLEDGWIEARDRLAELEPTVPATWLVLLDGPVWCIAGNIVHSRPFGPGGAETRHGTRLFKPNAKIYLASLDWSDLLLFERPHVYDRVRVVGRHRKSMEWIDCILRVAYTTNWRVELVYQPGALARLKAEGWPGFRVQKGEFKSPEEKKSPEAIRSLLDVLDRYRR